MMNMYYKWKGKNALRGNWQTAMVVAFFSGIFLVLTQVYQNRFMPVAIELIDGMYYWRFPQISQGVWIGFSVLQLCSVLLTPVLSVSCNHYFVRRVEGEELGTKGLFSRMNLMGKSLWLYVMMYVKIFLWTILLVVPGLIAAIRYSMAPYLLAEHPEMTAKEALEESKRIMKNRKGQYFLLLLSFIGWSLASNLLQLSLMSISGIAAIVAGLFVNCWVSAYVNASVAVFYKTVSEDGGEEKARQDWERIMQNMQNGVNFPGNPWNGPDDDDSDDDQDDDDSLN